ncbi:hypothetical protein VKT23_017496 [Stygiomarasmius scandens]|uniref:Uncharacterized protein n=1 Tax=Marasmiellus scandens TaxID=2682957 RepID=A0ABR1IRZ0_9AGAR
MVVTVPDLQPQETVLVFPTPALYHLELVDSASSSLADSGPITARNLPISPTQTSPTLTPTPTNASITTTLNSSANPPIQNATIPNGFSPTSPDQTARASDPNTSKKPIASATSSNSVAITPSSSRSTSFSSESISIQRPEQVLSKANEPESGSLTSVSSTPAMLMPNSTTATTTGDPSQSATPLPQSTRLPLPVPALIALRDPSEGGKLSVTTECKQYKRRLCPSQAKKWNTRGSIWNTKESYGEIREKKSTKAPGQVKNPIMVHINSEREVHTENPTSLPTIPNQREEGQDQSGTINAALDESPPEYTAI